jgi:hypothetical protein
VPETPAQTFFQRRYFNPLIYKGLKEIMMNPPTVLIIAGCIALLVGLFGGGVKAKEIEVPKISILPRIFSSVIGISLIWVGTTIFTQTDKTSPIPTETAAPVTVVVDPPSPTFEPTQPAAPIFNPATLTPVQPTFTSVPPTMTSIPPSPVPLPIVKIYSYDVSKCCGIQGTQMSPQIDYNLDIETLGVLQVEFTALNRLCSDMRLHILLDGVEWETSNYFGMDSKTTGVLDLGPVSSGKHTLKFQPEGRLGGCNTGYLESWGGPLVVYVSQYP